MVTLDIAQCIGLTTDMFITIVTVVIICMVVDIDIVTLMELGPVVLQFV